nr:putative LAGLIDADG homing endonuclease [Oedogonium sp. 244]
MNGAKRDFDERQQKYAKKANLVLQMSEKLLINIPYFHSWLSGFIEGEGCFSIRNQKNSNIRNAYSFSISQKGDSFLIYAIRQYLGASNKVRLLKNDMKSAATRSIQEKCFRKT